ncbi:hypothetical protein O3P69_002317 [Scylla paramamosain]|uniref:Uncharacterized protein n=1 Tax=Scylla paramamosain TaxID=85552 RepID=A0AAW0V895_SCYPA
MWLHGGVWSDDDGGAKTQESSVVRRRAGHLTHVLREGIDYRRVGVPRCEFWVTCPGLRGSLGPLIARREPPLPRQ